MGYAEYPKNRLNKVFQPTSVAYKTQHYWNNRELCETILCDGLNLQN